MKTDRTIFSTTINQNTELLEWLPETIKVNKEIYHFSIEKEYGVWIITYVDKNDVMPGYESQWMHSNELLPEALAQMLICLVENKIVSFHREEDFIIKKGEQNENR